MHLSVLMKDPAFTHDSDRNPIFFMYLSSGTASSCWSHVGFRGWGCIEYPWMKRQIITGHHAHLHSHLAAIYLNYSTSRHSFGRCEETREL